MWFCLGCYLSESAFGKKIVAIVSAEGEEVPLITHVEPAVRVGVVLGVEGVA